MVTYWVVFSDITRQVLFPFTIICGNDVFVLCLVLNEITCLLLWIFFVLPFQLQCYFTLWCPFPLVLVVVSNPFLLEQFSWKFSNSPPNSAPVADAMKFLMMLHSTCTGPFYWGIYVIGVLYFGPRKRYPPALLGASGSKM